MRFTEIRGKSLEELAVESAVETRFEIYTLKRNAGLMRNDRLDLVFISPLLDEKFNKNSSISLKPRDLLKAEKFSIGTLTLPIII